MTPREFEEFVERVLRAAEAEGTEIILDKRILDPDTGEIRQIDIEVQGPDGKISYVECRNHGRRQNVQWIEELMGRRESLGADGIVAVSANGFTKSAYRKAQARGVQTWDLSDLDGTDVNFLFLLPEVWFPVFREIRIFLRYIVPDSAYSMMNNGAMIGQIQRDASEAARKAIEFFFNEYNYNPVSAKRRWVSLDTDGEAICSGIRIFRHTFIEAYFSWEAVRPDVHKAVRRGPPDDRALVAEVHLAGFTGARVEMILGGNRWNMSVDLLDLESPAGGCVGHGIAFAHRRAEKPNIVIRRRDPKRETIDFAPEWQILSEAQAISCGVHYALSK